MDRQQREPRGEPRKDAFGGILPDQGEINGFPVTYENGRFVIWPPHYAQEQGDTAPMATRGSWSNAVGYIRDIAPRRRPTSPSADPGPAPSGDPGETAPSDDDPPPGIEDLDAPGR